MKGELIAKDGPVEIWLWDGEYYVYGVTGDPRVCHSEGAAYAVAAKA